MWFFSKRARKNMEESSEQLCRVKYSSVLTAQGDQAWGISVFKVEEHRHCSDGETAWD